MEKKENTFKTVIVDLLEDTYEHCRQYMYKQMNITHESDDSFRAWDKVRGEFLNTLKRLMNLDYENIVLISHEDTSRDLTRKGGDKISAIKPNIQDKIANKVAGMVDVVARIVADGGTYTFNFKYGAMMYGSNGAGSEPYFIVTNAGCRMSSTSADFYVAGGAIVASTEISTGSDRRIKNSIQYDMSKYEDFFMSLKPTQYKMNSGTSGRYHTGFIAQDVERALLDNGLSTQDFAGLTIEELADGFVKDGVSENFYQLRYGEFVSLNTYMIQKLYRRIEELESKINSMS